MRVIGTRVGIETYRQDGPDLAESNPQLFRVVSHADNCRNLDDASRCLGEPPLATLWRVALPLLRRTLVAAAILVFVDVMKEIPLTLSLRPFNFDTLATRAYQLAVDEQVAESANAALQVAASASQQASGVTQIQQAMRDINMVTTQNLSSTRQIESASQDLNLLSTRLREMVGAGG